MGEGGKGECQKVQKVRSTHLFIYLIIFYDLFSSWVHISVRYLRFHACDDL